jgi:zeaxanthin glucosyltransferase
LRFAFFSQPLPSHLAVHGALAQALAARGHQCFLIQHPGVEPFLRGGALRLAPIDPSACGWSPQRLLEHSRRPGFPFGVFRMVRDMAEMTESLCHQAPALVTALGVDGVVTDQMESAGLLVAEHLGLPVVTAAVAVPINREPNMPLPMLDWDYDRSEKGRKRNAGGERVADWLTRRLDRTIAAQARRLGCAPKQRQADCVSPWAEINQLLPSFDFPREAPPPGFHYVGPIRSTDSVGEMPFVASGGPFVFMSLGTMQGHRFGLFSRVAAACRRLGFRLMVAHCGGLSPAQASRLDADWVVERVPQEQAVGRADIVVSHAGLNTVMDALQAGKPQLCFPLAFDQPGLAARVRRLGAGEALPRQAGVDAVAAALSRLAGDVGYRARAASLAGEFAAAGGASRAAAIIEGVVRGARPDADLAGMVAA